ncbi:hypothetical protein [Mucilaginibacter xinganensis]|uniref:Uncharacterized protein n=1 Tax=Mucilaginibacter xinganensis TaxID=1234841 RepID=A0A223NW93_9SPHI|nr:hypothetical protein [Mucilaginibacter xinganensis]ASU34159.1 hypothetical protein MuYL_2270 [Mucilaginibacter xinganensis]
MKKQLKLIFFLLLLAGTFNACKKNSGAEAKPANTTGQFVFKLDGARIVIDSANAILYSTPMGRQMDVFAYKSGTQILEFHFDPKTGVKAAGTVLGAGAFLTYMESATQSYDSQSGVLTLTTCDTLGKKIEGDFNFVAKQYPYTGTAKTITEGHMLLTKISK